MEAGPDRDGRLAQEARDAERARIVAWLRLQAVLVGSGTFALLWAADSLEKGAE